MGKDRYEVKSDHHTAATLPFVANESTVQDTKTGEKATGTGWSKAEARASAISKLQKKSK